MTRLGVSVYGSRVLMVKGRKTGDWRTTPVNLLKVEGTQYLVAPRGHTQWVRNLKVAGGGKLLLGRSSQDFTAEELTEAEKPSILREYLQRWKWEVGTFFEGVGPEASREDLERIGPNHPIFRLKA